MKYVFFAMLALAGCTAAQVQSAVTSEPGQLFCAVQAAGGGAIVVGLVDAEATALAPAAAPVAILATNASKAFVDSACAAAGGIAVSPPSNPSVAPQLAVAVAALK